MNLSFGDIIGAASLLFGLVGLLGTFFFLSLTQWLSGILATGAAWKALTDRDPDKKDTASRLNCYYKAKESKSWVTFVAWCAITAFLFLVMWKLSGLQDVLKQDSQELIALYVIEPCKVFVFVYLLLSITFLVVGLLKASKVINKYEGDQ